MELSYTQVPYRKRLSGKKPGRKSLYRGGRIIETVQRDGFLRKNLKKRGMRLGEERLEEEGAISPRRRNKKPKGHWYSRQPRP